MWDLVGDPEDRFSDVAARIEMPVKGNETRLNNLKYQNIYGYGGKEGDVHFHFTRILLLMFKVLDSRCIL